MEDPGLRHAPLWFVGLVAAFLVTASVPSQRRPTATTVHGRVTYDGDEPVSGCTLTIHRVTDSAERVATWTKHVRTAADGAFTVSVDPDAAAPDGAPGWPHLRYEIATVAGTLEGRLLAGAPNDIRCRGFVAVDVAVREASRLPVDGDTEVWLRPDGHERRSRQTTTGHVRFELVPQDAVIELGCVTGGRRSRERIDLGEDTATVRRPELFPGCERAVISGRIVDSSGRPRRRGMVELATDDVPILAQCLMLGPRPRGGFRLEAWLDPRKTRETAASLVFVEQGIRTVVERIDLEPGVLDVGDVSIARESESITLGRFEPSTPLAERDLADLWTYVLDDAVQRLEPSLRVERDADGSLRVTGAEGLVGSRLGFGTMHLVQEPGRAFDCSIEWLATADATDASPLTVSRLGDGSVRALRPIGSDVDADVFLVDAAGETMQLNGWPVAPDADRFGFVAPAGQYRIRIAFDGVTVAESAQFDLEPGRRPTLEPFDLAELGRRVLVVLRGSRSGSGRVYGIDPNRALADATGDAIREGRADVWLPHRITTLRVTADGDERGGRVVRVTDVVEVRVDR